MSILWKLLKCQGGWMMAIPAAMSLVSSIIGATTKKGGGGLNKTGEEKSLQQYTENWLNRYRGQAEEPITQQYPYMQQGLQAAQQGGLFGAIQDAFNPNPTTTEQQAITGQARQLKNQALASGARGGLLRNQMLGIDKAAAANRLGLMESARQNAAQRGFQSLQGFLPTQATDIARRNQLFNYDQLANQNWTNLADLGVKRNLAGLQQGSKEGQGIGGGLGGLLGSIPGLSGLFGSGAQTGGLGGAAGSSGETGILGDFNSTGASGLFGSFSSMFSSRDFKEAIEPVDLDAVLDELDKTNIYLWQYRPAFSHDTRRHIGPVVEEAPATIVDGKALNIQDTVGFLLATVKALNEKVKKLENAN